TVVQSEGTSVGYATARTAGHATGNGQTITGGRVARFHRDDREVRAAAAAGKGKASAGAIDGDGFARQGVVQVEGAIERDGFGRGKHGRVKVDRHGRTAAVGVRLKYRIGQAAALGR